jgi:hypothetical protein
MQKALERYSGQETTPPEEVAKAILKAVTSDNPDIRYVVANDAIQLMEAKKRMSDLEFEGLIKQQFFLVNNMIPAALTESTTKLTLNFHS